jgi:hypothetical protein
VIAASAAPAARARRAARGIWRMMDALLSGHRQVNGRNGQRPGRLYGYRPLPG